MDASNKLISRARAAELAGLSKKTVMRWEKAGRFPPGIRMGRGRAVRYVEREVMQFIRDLEEGRELRTWADRRERREREREALEHARSEHELRLARIDELAQAPRSVRR